MSNGYIGLAIGNALNTSAAVITATASSSGVASSSVSTQADKNGVYFVLGQAGINYRLAAFFTGTSSSSGSASVSGVGKPFGNAKGTTAGKATVAAEGQTNGQAGFTLTASATVSGVTAAQKDALFAINIEAQVFANTQTTSEVIGTANGTNLANGDAQRLRLFINGINDHATANQVTTNKAQSDIITTSRTYGSSLTKAA